MAFKRWGYTFDGAYASPSQLEAGAGIYLVWCRKRVENHERKSCWERNCRGGALRYAVYYMPGARQFDRIVVEGEIRNAARPPCGER
jgi:hypothetical protein